MTQIPVTATTSHNYLADWLVSLKILHRGHWDSARWYDRAHLVLGIATGISAAISGTTAFTTLAGNQSSVVAGMLGLVAAVLAAVQTALRASELSARHKDAGIRFGQLRRELEQQLALGFGGRADAEPWLDEFRSRWNTADDQSPPVPPRFYRAAKASISTAPRD